MKKSILATLLLSGLLSANCVNNGDSTVSCDTGLTWQDNSDIKYVKKYWTEAIEYCNTLSLAGGGWRLPNIIELKSIVDKSKYEPALKDGFTQKEMGKFWTSTTHKPYVPYAWIVHFKKGDISWSSKDNSMRNVRCVRDEQ